MARCVRNGGCKSPPSEASDSDLRGQELLRGLVGSHYYYYYYYYYY